MSIAYMIIYMTACLIFELHAVSFYNFVHQYTACLLCKWCSLHANGSQGQICSYNIWHFAAKSFHRLILHALRCTVNDHHHYHSSIVCGSTSMDSTPITLRGCMLSCNHIENYVIATLHPWA